MIDQIKNWPRGVWLAILAWIAMSLFYTKPCIDDILQRYRTNQKLSAQVAQISHYQRVDKELTKRIQKRQRQLAAFSTIVSQDSTQPDFIGTIQDVAVHNHIRISSFQPLKTNKTQNAVEISLENRYEHIGRFINCLERHSHLYRIPAFCLEKQIAKPNMISATILIAGEEIEREKDGI